MEIIAKKFLHRFDESALVDDLNKVNSADWINHYRTDNFEGSWAVLPLRSVGGHPLVIYATPAGDNPDFYQNTPHLNSCSYFQSVLNWFECKINAARLLRLDAGSKILEHTDPMNYGNGEEWRIHIPILTNENIEFVVGGRKLEMKPGEIWYADFNLPHYVINHSNKERVHLVLDCELNDWLRDEVKNGL